MTYLRWMNFAAIAAALGAGVASAEPQPSSEVEVGEPYSAGTFEGRPITSMKISRETWDGQWFLVYPKAVLSCEGRGGVGLVTITAGGRTFPVNGLAKSRADARGWHNYDAIWLTDEMNPPARVSNDAIKVGLRLCR
jgi:hypothetical protein